MIIAAYTVIEHQDRFLLTKDKGKNGWKIPGGKIEPDEHLLSGSLREIKEETNLEIIHTGLISIQQYNSKSGESRIRFYFLGQIKSGSASALNEVEKIHWISKLDSSNLQVSDFFLPTYYQAIQKYLNNQIFPLSIFDQTT